MTLTTPPTRTGEVEVLADSLGGVSEAEALVEAFMREHKVSKLLTVIKALHPHHWQI